MKGGKVFIYGRNALFEALSANPKAIKKVHIKDIPANKEIIKLLQKQDINFEILKEKKGTETRSEQGIIASIDTNSLFKNTQNFLKDIKISSDSSVIVLDGINDPHNVGAIIRSGAAFGASAVMVPEHGSASITSGVISASAGMVFKTKLIAEKTAPAGITELKKAGFKIYGLDMNGTSILDETKFSSPTVFVVGNEGVGLADTTRKLCDEIISIKINPRCESLNAAVSVGAVMYEWSRQHKNSLK